MAGEGVRVSRVDLAQEPEPDIACAEWMRRSMATALPLTDGGTLVEATLLVESPDVTHLHIKAHHIVADGWTVDRLSHEILDDFARATGAGRESTGRREPSSYLAFVEEEAAYRAGAGSERDRAFHREALAGVAPALFTRTADGSGRCRHSFVFEGPLVDRVRAAGLSPFAYLTAMFGTWLTRLHRSEEAVLGIPFLNRPEAHHKDVLGQFANTLPLRVAAHGGRTVRSWSPTPRRRPVRSGATNGSRWATSCVNCPRRPAPASSSMWRSPTCTGRGRHRYRESNGRRP